MVYVDRMVGGLGELMKYAHLAATLRRRREHGKTELFAAHCLGT